MIGTKWMLDRAHRLGFLWDHDFWILWFMFMNSKTMTWKCWLWIGFKNEKIYLDFWDITFNNKYATWIMELVCIYFNLNSKLNRKPSIMGCYRKLWLNFFLGNCGWISNRHRELRKLWVGYYLLHPFRSK